MVSLLVKWQMEAMLPTCSFKTNAQRYLFITVSTWQLGALLNRKYTCVSSKHIYISLHFILLIPACITRVAMASDWPMTPFCPQPRTLKWPTILARKDSRIYWRFSQGGLWKKHTKQKQHTTSKQRTNKKDNINISTPRSKSSCTFRGIEFLSHNYLLQGLFVFPS